MFIGFSYFWTYVIIVIRDLSILVITVYFLISVNRRETDLQTVLAKKDTVLDLMELDSVLCSVTPMIAFQKYIDEKQQGYSALLKFVKISKLYFEQVEDMKMIDDEIDEIQK